METPTIVVATTDGRYYFRPEEIVRLEASSNYTRIFFTNSKKMLTSRLLKEYAMLLEPLGFVRTHRSHLVNKRYISQVEENGCSILMQDASRAEVSRRKRNNVMRALQAA